ncbi:hypothetical protein S40288_09864 [Stachybotrys chartarum IBT 40288]|nr:hypothetical protein S40288_09864 [Stachybotrys chartarum IBT 40288]
MSGVRGIPPHKPTKVGLTALGDYKSELHWAAVGLDIKEKARMLELQIKASLGSKLDRFTHFDIQIYGEVLENPKNQNTAMLDLRLVAQSRYGDAFLPANFGRSCLDMIMNTFPAATITMRMPTASPEYFPALILQSAVTVHFADYKGKDDIIIAPLEMTLEESVNQLSYAAESPCPWICLERQPASL